MINIPTYYLPYEDILMSGTMLSYRDVCAWGTKSKSHTGTQIA